MLWYLLRKLPSVLGVLLVSSVLAFALPRLAPGDVAVVLAGPDPTAAAVQGIREQLGLDRPLVVQYFDWITGLVHGDLGESYLLRRSVASLIADRLASTVQLAVAASGLAVILGFTLGVLAGSVRRAWLRSLIDVVNSALIGVPNFLVGIGLILVFGIFNHLLPVSGEASVIAHPAEGLRYLILPAVALALSPAAVVARLVQTEMLRVRNDEFVDLAVSKGASSSRVTVRHVLRNSLGPAVVTLGVQFGNILAGAVVIEAIFARNGLGQLAASSVQLRDFPTLQVLILGAVLVAVVMQLCTEIGLAALDPRIRLGGRR